MDIRNLKNAEDFLIEATQNKLIKNFVKTEVETWDFQDCNNRLDVANINQLFHEFNQELFSDTQTESKTEALHWLVFDDIHDICMLNLKIQFNEEDVSFFEKCKLLTNLNISAEQFGVDENLSVPLAAAIVELSVLDTFKTPTEKINCLCTSYDLVFAEIKTAMVSVISQNANRENEIPIINNQDVIPLVMVVIIKSKLAHIFSNLFYVKSFYFQLCKNREVSNIFHSFEQAVESIVMINVNDLLPVTNKLMKSLDLEEYMKKTSEESKKNQDEKKTLVDEANQRVLNLITQATFDQ